MKVFAVVVSGLFLAAGAQANDTNASENGQQPASATAERNNSTAEEGEGSERRICRRIEENTGSRTSGRRVCLTAEQWRNYRARF